MSVNGVPSNGENLPEGLRRLEDRGPENNPTAKMVGRLGLESLGNQATYGMPQERPSLSDDENRQLPEETKLSKSGRFSALFDNPGQKCSDFPKKGGSIWSRLCCSCCPKRNSAREESPQRYPTSFKQENRNYLKETQSSGLFEKKRREVAVKFSRSSETPAMTVEEYKTLKEKVIARKRMTQADQDRLQTFIRGLSEQKQEFEIFEIARVVPEAVALIDDSLWIRGVVIKAISVGEKALPFIPKETLKGRGMQKKLEEFYPPHVLTRFRT